jgi:hypothetical protein
MSPVKYELGFYIPEDGILHSHSRENLKSYTANVRSSVILPTLMMEAIRYSETFGSYESHTASHPIRRHSLFFSCLPSIFRSAYFRVCSPYIYFSPDPG